MRPRDSLQTTTVEISGVPFPAPSVIRYPTRLLPHWAWQDRWTGPVHNATFARVGWKQIPDSPAAVRGTLRQLIRLQAIREL